MTNKKKVLEENMKRLRTIGVLLIAVVALLAIAAALVALLLPETDLLRKNVEEQLTKLTGQDVALGGLKLSWTFPKLVHISLENVSVRTKDGEQLLAADKVTCSPALLSLIQGKVIIESISLEGFRAQIRRLADGSIRSPLVPLPGSHPTAAMQEKLPETEEETGLKKPAEPLEAVDMSKPRLSIKQVSFAEGKIDWVDEHVNPGRDTRIFISDIKGRVSVADSEQDFVFTFSAIVGSLKPGENEVRFDGSVGLTPELSAFQQVRVSVSTELFYLEPFLAYMPKNVPIGPGTVIKGGRAHLNWYKDRPPVFAYEAEFMPWIKDRTRVRLQGDSKLATDFSSVKEATFTVETDAFLLDTISRILPPGFPLISGILKGRFNGKWYGPDAWSVHADAQIERAFLEKYFQALRKALAVSVQATVQPKEILIERLDIAESSKIASVSGKIREPFSEKMPVLDLNGEISLNPRWLPALGVHLTDNLRIGGSFPVRGAVKGKPDDLEFDVTGDLTGVPIEWQTHLTKQRGQKGSFSSKGRWLPKGGKAAGQVRLDAMTRLELAGLSLRLAPETGTLQPASLNLAARVLVDGKKIDARDGTLGLRKGSDAKDFLTIKGTVTDLSAADPVIDAQATTTVSSELLSLAGLDSSRGVSIKGSAPLAASFSGPLSSLSWRLQMPIDHIDIAVGKSFRKPSDVAGSLKASGKLAAGELTLDQGQLTLPGASVTGRGLVRDRNGNPGQLKFDLKKGEIDKLLKYFPEVTYKGLSGPVEASLTLTPSDKRLIPVAVVRPIAISYRPDKADWHLEGLSGSLDIKDDSVAIPEIVGKVAGIVEAPLKITGALKGVTSGETANGTISIALCKGRIKSNRVPAILLQIRGLVGPLLDPEFGKRGGDFLGFNSLTGDLRVSAGTVSTDSIQLKGSDLNAGGMGSLRLDSLHLDMVVGLYTEVVGGSAIGKIPGVGEFLKKHQEVLKGTGLDKELKRWGITPPDQQEASASQSGVTRTPVTVFARIRGPLSSPQVSPVLENALKQDELSRLRSLIH